MAVNYNRRKSNISNRDWSNYSEKQNAKYMSKQLRDLGYKVPSYMKKGQINLKQIEYHVNRMTNKLTNLVEKQLLSKMSKSERNKFRLEKQYNNLKEKNNKQVREVHKWIDENYNGYKADYLKGENFEAPNIRDNSAIRNNSPRFINNMMGNINDIIKTAKRMVKNNTLENFKKSLDISEERVNNEFKQFLNETWITSQGGLTPGTIGLLETKWNTLDIVEKELMVKGVFNRLRDIYQDMDEGDYIDPINTAINNFNWDYEDLMEARK